VSKSHPEYSEYATCTVCGLHKYCRQVNRYFVCYSCDNGNFKGLKNIKNKDKQL
jgi:hypothetical protein